MTCTQTQPLLDACADHALGIWQTVRVRRHLAGCAACTAQLADIQRLNASVQAWRNASAPAVLEGQIAAALPVIAFVPTPLHDRRIARRTAVGLASVAAAIAATIWFLPGQPGQPTIAFADVERAMQQVRTVSWLTTVHTSFAGRTGHKVETHSVEQTWLRRDPAAIATFRQLPGYLRGTWSLEDSSGMIIRNIDSTYLVHKLNANVDMTEMVEQEVRRLTQMPTQNIPSHPIGVTRVKVAPLQEHETTLNGHAQILFVRNVDIATTSNPAPPQPIHISERTWVDPITRRVTQIAIDNMGGPMGPGWRSSFVESSFQYNQTPPASVFDWSPPKGAKVTKF